MIWLIKALSITHALAATDSFSINKLVIHPNTGSTLIDLVAKVVNSALSLGGAIAFIYLMIGGFRYIMAGGDSAKADQARTAIYQAIIGIICILLSLSLVVYVTKSIGSSGGGGSGTIKTVPDTPSASGSNLTPSSPSSPSTTAPGSTNKSKQTTPSSPSIPSTTPTIQPKDAGINSNL